MGFVFSIFMFSGVISAAALNVTETELAASGVKNFTETYNDIPGYVVVNNKNSSSPSFLKTTTTWTIQLNNGATTPVTISIVNAPTGPSGSATGTLSKSEYLTVATNVKNFITSNGRAPNYASSSLGNIRYESLLYTYSKVLDFYKSNGRLPNTVSVVYVVGVRTNGVVIPPQDYAPPTVTANPVGGVYGSTRIVTLTATDNHDLHPSIYYTLNGSTPTTSSTRYTNPININTPGNTILKFMARDASGNQAAVQTMTYTLKLVKNIRTGNIYTSIQSAIDDSSTLNGDIIQVHAGTFTENILITKKLTLMAVTGENVILRSQNSYGTIIRINSPGNGTTIRGFIINGSTSTTGIFLHNVSDCVITGNTINNDVSNNNANGVQSYGAINCTISENDINHNGMGIWLTYNSTSNNIQHNSLTYNNFNGIQIDNSNKNTVQDNIASYNKGDGIYIYYSNFNNILNNTAMYQNNDFGNAGISVYSSYYNSVLNNILKYNGFGLYLGYSLNNTIRKNTITNNGHGIYIMNSSDKINYNNIYSNSKIGLINNGEGTSNASRNWWGHSSAPTQGSTDGNDYYNNGGSCPIEPWLIQNANAYIIYNENTQLLFTTIQEAINDSTTSPGDTIKLDNRSYNENIIINKKVNLKADDDANPTTIGTITINSGGCGTKIQGLTINGNINLNANNCTIIDNIIIGNGTSGIIASNSINNKIAYNDITSNGFNGIQSNSSSNKISYNTIHGCVTGIYSENSINTIIGNNIINNYNGICTYNSTDTIQFNRITENTYGLKNEIGTINATNNWWGSNFPVVSSNSPSDIYIVSGTVTYNPSLILRVNVSSTNSGGKTSVTADLTHNNQGEDTSSQGHVPNGIPVNFTTNFGTIINSAYTFKGKATTILNLGSTQNATVTAGASVDHQSASTTGLISTGTAVLNITSTAIDNATGQPLNITYNISLNSSVTWLSVIWIPTGMFSDELKIMVNGIVVEDKFFHNIAYTTWMNSYSSSVFDAILDTNLQFGSGNVLTAFWDNLATTYNLNATELSFVKNHRLDFIDNITFDIEYPGVPGLNLTITDPESNNDINLNFPGNVIHRTSQIIYVGSPYEGLKSFAIATTKVTNDVVNYWWSQYSFYQSSDYAAFVAFYTALLVEYSHDQIGDNITSDVTWDRTSPIIVSFGDEHFETYLTLESDHSMGMTVVGTPENVREFNFVTSSNISVIEFVIMNSMRDYLYLSSPNVNFSSVMVDLVNDYLFDPESLDISVQNGFIIISSEFNNGMFIVIDLETGIVRDMNTINNFCGVNLIVDLKAIAHFTPNGPTSIFGHQLVYGPVNLYWDGLGDVFIANGYWFYGNHDPVNDQIWVVGEFVLLVNGVGVYTFGNHDGGLVYHDDIDITSFLNIGYNTIAVVINSSGDTIGNSWLWAIEVYDRDEEKKPPQTFPIPAPDALPIPYPWNMTNPPINIPNDWPIEILINSTDPIKIFPDDTNFNWYTNEEEIPDPKLPLPPIPVYTDGQWMWLRLYLYI